MASEEKIKALTEKLESGVKAVFESEQYKAYLKAMSKFHNYSFGNIMLILIQCPNASAVAGFNKWKKDFGRTVKKGERGIAIIAPTPYKKLVEREKIDPVSKKPIIGQDGKAEKESVFLQLNSYKVAYVFDVSQTEGRPLPSYGVDELKGIVDNYDSMLKAVTAAAPVPVYFRPPEESKGCYKHKEQAIYINEGMTHIDTLSVLIHEIAHAKLHALPVKDGEITGKHQKNRRTREVEAESVAYVVSQHFGIETGESSFAYITGWSKGKELDELKSSLDCICSTAGKIIDDIESNIPELAQSKEESRSKPNTKAKCVSR